MKPFRITNKSTTGPAFESELEDKIWDVAITGSLDFIREQRKPGEDGFRGVDIYFVDDIDIDKYTKKSSINTHMKMNMTAEDIMRQVLIIWEFMLTTTLYSNLKLFWFVQVE